MCMCIEKEIDVLQPNDLHLWFS